MAELFTNPARATDSGNTPLPGAKLYFYATGTTTPASVYTTSALSVAHPHPVVADSAGQFPAIYLDPTVNYRAVCKDTTGATTVYDLDPVNIGLSGSSGSAGVGFLQSGAGAVAQTVQDKLREAVSVKDFGAVGDNATNDSTAFAAAISAVSALANGGDVLVPSGRYLITQQTIPANVRIIMNEGAEIKPHSSTASLFLISGGLSGIYGGRLANQSSRANAAVLIDKPFDNLSVFINDCYVASFTEAVKTLGGDCVNIKDNTFISNGVAILSVDEFVNCNISGNYILGGNGIRLQKTLQGPEGVTIYGNKILPASGGTFCIKIEAGLEVDIFSNILDQIITGDGIAIDGAGGEIANVKIHHNWIGRQAAAAGADYGIYAVNTIRGLHITSNTFVGFTEANIHLNGAGANKLRDVLIRDNVHYYADPALRDIALTDVTDVLIDGETFSGTASIVENSGVTGRVINCDLNGLPSISGGLRYGLQKSGMVLTNTGTATVATPSRVATVTHGLSYTPTAQQITVMPTTFPSNDPGYFIVDTIGATTFRIVAANDPGANCDVVWKADLTR